MENRGDSDGERSRGEVINCLELLGWVTEVNTAEVHHKQ